MNIHVRRITEEDKELVLAKVRKDVKIIPEEDIQKDAIRRYWNHSINDADFYTYLIIDNESGKLCGHFMVEKKGVQPEAEIYMDTEWENLGIECPAIKNLLDVLKAEREIEVLKFFVDHDESQLNKELEKLGAVKISTDATGLLQHIHRFTHNAAKKYSKDEAKGEDDYCLGMYYALN